MELPSGHHVDRTGRSARRRAGHHHQEKTLHPDPTPEALRGELADCLEAVTALRASEAEWRALIETMPQIVWITRPDGWHVDFNQQWLDFTGRSLEESLGHGWNPAFHPDDRARAAARWEEATRTGQPYEVEYRLRRADGTYHWMLGRAAPLRDADGEIVKWFGTCTDIEELKQAQARIEEQARLLHIKATRDALTGLANRALMFEQLELLLGQRQGTGVGVVFVDLDGFKAVNDELGHRAGDQLLVHVAQRLRSMLRHGDVVARIGGDEFVVVGEADDERGALGLGERLAEAVNGPAELDAGVVTASVSVGVAFVRSDERVDADEVLSRADGAMYEAKRRTPGSVALERREPPAGGVSGDSDG